MEPTNSFPTVAKNPRIPVRLLNASLVIACFAFTGAGLAFVNLCDGGYSLILFGGGVACLAYLIYRMGAWATIIPFVIIVVSLVGGGLYGVTAAGCHF